MTILEAFDSVCEDSTLARGFFVCLCEKVFKYEEEEWVVVAYQHYNDLSDARKAKKAILAQSDEEERDFKVLISSKLPYAPKYNAHVASSS